MADPVIKKTMVLGSTPPGQSRCIKALAQNAKRITVRWRRCK